MRVPLLAAALFWTSAIAAREPAARVDDGALRGVAADGVRTFMGISYAAPHVVDENRASRCHGDADLAHASARLGRGAIAQIRVHALPIGEDLDVVEHRRPRFRASAGAALADVLDVKYGEETFHGGIDAPMSVNMQITSDGESRFGTDPWHARLDLAAAAAEPAVPPQLAGTAWRWTRFVSPLEDFVVAEPERYTLAFDAAGRIALRADCNRGSAGVAFPEPGALRVGAMALTRARCPPDSLGDRFARDVARAVRWSLREGELYLELPMDSGTLRFARQP
jgi:heat shock protein HslJ